VEKKFFWQEIFNQLRGDEKRHCEFDGFYYIGREAKIFLCLLARAPMASFNSHHGISF